MKVRVRICSRLYEALSEQTLEGTLHSCFHRAMNMAYENGLVTFLAKEKSLQPFSLNLDWSGDFLFVKELVRSRGTEMRLNMQGLWIGTYQVFEFETFEILNLKKRQSEILNPVAANFIRSFLSHQEEKGIHGLIEGRTEDVFSAFLASRIEAFREAVQNGERETAVYAAGQLAGGGPGLTPSSDDFLCGYIVSWPENYPWEGFAETVTGAAASRTNDVSGSLLKHAGEGMFSEDVLGLLEGFANCDTEQIRTALKRVACFGSSSGCDFLTGMYYGVIDSNKMGGNRCGKA